MKTITIVLAFVFIALSICSKYALLHFGPSFSVVGIDGTGHVKHAILYAVLAILCLLWYRFQTNAKTN